MSSTFGPEVTFLDSLTRLSSGCERSTPESMTPILGWTGSSLEKGCRTRRTRRQGVHLGLAPALLGDGLDLRGVGDLKVVRDGDRPPDAGVGVLGLGRDRDDDLAAVVVVDLVAGGAQQGLELGGARGVHAQGRRVDAAIGRQRGRVVGGQGLGIEADRGDLGQQGLLDALVGRDIGGLIRVDLREMGPSSRSWRPRRPPRGPPGAWRRPRRRSPGGRKSGLAQQHAEGRHGGQGRAGQLTPVTPSEAPIRSGVMPWPRPR